MAALCSGHFFCPQTWFTTWRQCRVSRITGEVIRTPKITAKSREGSTDGWIGLAVHPPAVARDALGRVVGESVLLASVRRPAFASNCSYAVSPLRASRISIGY